MTEDTAPDVMIDNYVDLWTKEQKCSVCLNAFTVGASDIRYEDMRKEGFYQADFQFCVTCPFCSKINVIRLPSRIAVWVQLNVLPASKV